VIAIDPVAEALVETELRLRQTRLASIRDGLLPHQRRPAGDWKTWAVVAGRGAGKTFLGSNEVVSECRVGGPNSWPIIIAPTLSDARDVCIEGPSGIWTLFRSEFSDYNRTRLILRHVSGATVKAFGAEKPDRLRGPQSSFLWIDEAAIVDRETIENALFGLRLGVNPRVLLTTTPRPTTFLKETIADPTTVVTKATSFDNPHVSERALDSLRKKFDGTRLGRQELLGEFLEEAEGALWRMVTIDANRIRPENMPEVVRTVVAIDPATTKKKKSDFTGLAVASECVDGNYYTRFSVGLKVSPRVWARRAIDLYHEYEADVMIGEVNQGGDMVETTIQTEWRDAPLKMIHASKGKRVRAEPVATLAEQGRVKYVGKLTSLEDQLINFGYTVEPEHDDELDAHVYTITELMGEEPELLFRRLGS